MKKTIKVISIMAVLLALAGTLFATGAGETTSKVDRIKAAGKVVMGTEAQYAPYEFKDANANIVGCDVYIGQQIAEALGVQLEIVDMAFDGIIPAIQSGQVDIGIAAFTKTPERAEVIDFSNTYEDSLQYLVVATGNENVYNSVESLVGQKVGAQRGTIQSQLIKSTFPQSELFELAKYPELATEVRLGNIAGLVVDSAVGDSLIAASDGALTKSNFEFDAEEANFGKAVIVQQGNDDLLEIVNSVVDRIVADGSYAQAYDEAVALQQQMGL